MDVRFPSQHHIGALTITCYDDTRVLVVNETAVRLSSTEYRIIRSLLAGQFVEDDDLMLAAYQEKNREDIFRKQIDRLRKKLRATNLYLHRTISVSYVLNDRPPG